MKEIEIQKKLLKQSIWIECSECKGEGKIHHESIFYDNNDVKPFKTFYYTECSVCQGTGKILKPQSKRNFLKTLL